MTVNCGGEGEPATSQCPPNRRAVVDGAPCSNRSRGVPWPDTAVAARGQRARWSGRRAARYGKLRAMNLTVAAPTPAPTPAPALPSWDRPSPPDFGGILKAAALAFPARPGYGDPYSTADQQRVASAAMAGARTGAEVASAAGAVKLAFPARPGYGDPYTVANQIDVVTAALASWYELESLPGQLQSIKQAMPARPGYGDPYTPQQQVAAAVAVFSGRPPHDRLPLPPISA